jgi:hypothetical protein
MFRSGLYDFHPLVYLVCTGKLALKSPASSLKHFEDGGYVFGSSFFSSMSCKLC